MPSIQKSNRETIAEKSITPIPSKGKEYQVDLTISRGEKQTATRIFDQLLDGFIAEPMDVKGATFSVSNNLVEFYWETLPKDSVFKVSYKLVADTSKAAIMADADKNALVTQPDLNSAPTSTLNAANGNTVAAAKDLSPVTLIPAPEKGIYYKVQIAATKRSPERSSDFFKSKYKIDEAVALTMHDGWKKYLVGTFDRYAVAKQHRVETQAKISDAFVVAYNNGERISLQQAIKTKQVNE